MGRSGKHLHPPLYPLRDLEWGKRLMQGRGGGIAWDRERSNVAETHTSSTKQLQPVYLSYGRVFRQRTRTQSM
jgi:hypothetical protein